MPGAGSIVICLAQTEQYEPALRDEVRHCLVTLRDKRTGCTWLKQLQNEYELRTGRPNAPSSGRISASSGWPWAAPILCRGSAPAFALGASHAPAMSSGGHVGVAWTCHVTQLRWPGFSATVAARLRRRSAAGRFGVGPVPSGLASPSSRELRSSLGKRAGTSPAYC